MIDVGSFLQHNQFASGGLLIGVVGGAAAWLRSVPTHIYSWVKRQLVIEVEVRSRTANMYNNKLYKYLGIWIIEKTKHKPKRTLKGSIMDLYDPVLDEEKETFVYSLGSGSHLLFFNKTPIWVSVHRDTSSKEQDVESYDLTFFTRDQNRVNALFDEVISLKDSVEEGLQKVYGTDRYGDWTEVTKRTPRSLDSVVLPKKQKTFIVEALDNFLISRKRYESLGIPWRFGLMLYGPPGTGKSSFMTALAHHLKRNIYFLSLSSKMIDDSQLIKLVNDVPKNGIIFLEDIDCVLPSRSKNKDEGKEVTLSGILNALDGVMSKDGQIVFMSTNHIDKVDPAILRPGRVDLSVELSYAVPEQAEELYGRFYPESPLTERKEFGKLADGKTTMAQLQNILIEKDKSR